MIGGSKDNSYLEISSLLTYNSLDHITKPMDNEFVGGDFQPDFLKYSDTIHL